MDPSGKLKRAANKRPLSPLLGLGTLLLSVAIAACAGEHGDGPDERLIDNGNGQVNGGGNNYIWIFLLCDKSARPFLHSGILFDLFKSCLSCFVWRIHLYREKVICGEN